MGQQVIDQRWRRFGDDHLQRCAVHRHLDTQHRADGGGPGAAGIDDATGADGAARGVHGEAGAGAAVTFDALDIAAANETRTARQRMVRHRIGGGERIDLAFQRAPLGAQHGRRQRRRHAAQLVAADHMRLDAVAPLERHLGFEEAHAGFAVGDHQAAGDFQVEIDAAVARDLLPQRHRRRPERQGGGGRAAALLSLRAEVERQQLHMQAAGIRARGLQVDVVTVDHQHVLAGARQVVRQA